MLQARSKAAKANEELQKTLGGIGTSSAMGAFERMENKVLEQEARSQAVGELGGYGIEQQFAELESSTDVDDELAMFKAQMSGGALPAASSPATPQIEASKTAAPTDGVIDAEFEELRSKLNDL